MQPHRRQPTRLPRPWDSPGKNTGVGCHFLLQCMQVKSESEVVSDSSDPMDCSLPGSSIHGLFQSKVLEWGAIAFSVRMYTYVIIYEHYIAFYECISFTENDVQRSPNFLFSQSPQCLRKLSTVPLGQKKYLIAPFTKQFNQKKQRHLYAKN